MGLSRPICIAGRNNAAKRRGLTEARGFDTLKIFQDLQALYLSRAVKPFFVVMFCI